MRVSAVRLSHRMLSSARIRAKHQVDIGGKAAQQIGHVVVDEVEIVLLHVDLHQPVGNAGLVAVGKGKLQVVHEQQVQILEHIEGDQHHTVPDDEIPDAGGHQHLAQQGVQATLEKGRVHDDVDQRQNGGNTQQFQKTADDKGHEQQEQLPFLPGIQNVVKFFQHMCRPLSIFMSDMRGKPLPGRKFGRTEQPPGRGLVRYKIYETRCILCGKNALLRYGRKRTGHTVTNVTAY